MHVQYSSPLTQEIVSVGGVFTILSLIFSLSFVLGCLKALFSDLSFLYQRVSDFLASKLFFSFSSWFFKECRQNAIEMGGMRTQGETGHLVLQF